MKIQDYLPELPSLLKQHQDVVSLYNSIDLMKSTSEQSGVYRTPTLGLDVLYSSWVSQQMAYRQQLITQVIEFGKNVEEVRGPVNHIVSEVFRRGLQWKSKFEARCDKCNINYSEDVDMCKKCYEDSNGKDKGKLRKPDLAQRGELQKFLSDCNIWKQSLEEVLRSIWWDVNICDDFFLYISKEYKMDKDKNVRSKPTEIRRLNPALVEWDLDSGGLPENAHFMCYIHRDTSLSSEPGECEDCGSDLVPAMYRYFYQGKTLYLFSSEVIHDSKFTPTETFGYSPILTLLSKILTIRGMDLNLFRYFFERKMPASMLMVFTDDAESLRRERQHIETRMRNDPNYIPMIAVSTKQQRGRADLIKLFHTLQEMDYLPVREEIRERIAAMWGVTPVWQGAPDAVGGTSAQSQQLVVMSRVVEADQRLIHEKIFPKLLEAFGITDWVMELIQPEEKAEATRISFAQQRISAANMLVQMGFDVKIKSDSIGIDDINFVVSGEAINMAEQQQQMMGGMTGGDGDLGEPIGEPIGPSISGEENTMMGSEGGEEEMTKSLMINEQIMQLGHSFPVYKEVGNEGNYIIFESVGKGLFKADIFAGKVTNIEKFISPRMHRHRGSGYHDINIPHNNTLSRKPKHEDSIWGAEGPDEIDLDNDDI